MWPTILKIAAGSALTIGAFLLHGLLTNRVHFGRDSRRFVYKGDCDGEPVLVHFDLDQKTGTVRVLLLSSPKHLGGRLNMTPDEASVGYPNLAIRMRTEVRKDKDFPTGYGYAEMPAAELPFDFILRRGPKGFFVTIANHEQPIKMKRILVPGDNIQIPFLPPTDLIPII